MASAETFPIYYTQDVHGFYQKQKTEFHFNQKTDNEFLMFLLDTAVRVISIVQHLAPVIEAVSDASADNDETEEAMSPLPNQINNSGLMDVDTTHPTPLSAELEQINLEITNAQISQNPQRPIPAVPAQLPAPTSQTSTASSIPVMQSVTTTAPVQQQQQPEPPTTSQISIPAAAAVSSTAASSTPTSSASQSPAVPHPQPVSSAQNITPQAITTSVMSATQPVAEAPTPSTDHTSDEIKSEDKPVAEVVEIKEEVTDSATAASNNLLSPDTIQQLMSTISNNEENVGLQNFVTTANPSNLPPSFLDRSSTNPLSMLGSINNSSGDSAGPSGITVPNIGNIPESMMKNINDAGLNVSNIKGQSNPSGVLLQLENGKNRRFTHFICRICGVNLASKASLNRHVKLVHLKQRDFNCHVCGKAFGQKSDLKHHVAVVHKEYLMS